MYHDIDTQKRKGRMKSKQLTLYKSITNSSGFGAKALLTYTNWQTMKSEH